MEIAFLCLELKVIDASMTLKHVLLLWSEKFCFCVLHQGAHGAQASGGALAGAVHGGARGHGSRDLHALLVTCKLLVIRYFLVYFDSLFDK